MADVANNPLNMSDEDILKVGSFADLPDAPAPEETNSEDPAPKKEEPEAVVDDKTTDPAPKDETDDKKDPVEKADGAEGKPDGEKDTEGDPVPEKAKEQQGEKKPEGEKPEGAVPAAGSKEAEPKAEQVDYEAFHKEIMKPFKANGKEIQLKDLGEVRQLLQQGANYTRKMQAIAPHRKLLTMLESNSLLSEDKLSFLIDLEKGDPAAVQKLLKDKGIDAMSIDTEAETNYTGGAHKVTDTDVAFNTNLRELSSTDEGNKTLDVVNAWDDASKAELFSDPDLMMNIHDQRESGIYDRITSEVERRKTLGKISATTSFIKAYASVGAEMDKAGAFADLSPESKDTTAAPAPKVDKVAVATTTAKPKQPVDNNDKAAAASSTNGGAKPAKTIVNPLSLSDDEFEKQFSQFTGRV